jgi:hypothetical protein
MSASTFSRRKNSTDRTAAPGLRQPAGYEGSTGGKRRYTCHRKEAKKQFRLMRSSLARQPVSGTCAARWGNSFLSAEAASVIEKPWEMI